MIEQMLAYNREIVKSEASKKFQTSKYPDKKIAILTCMDTRLVELLPAAVQGVFTYPMLVYAAVLIVVILFRPKGIFGTYEFSLIHLGRDLKAARAAKAAAKAERKEANIHA